MWTPPHCCAPASSGIGPCFERSCPPALAALDRGGTRAVAGIYLTDIPSFDYEGHLFQERTLRRVTANTRDDGRGFLEIAERIGIRPTTTVYPFSYVDRALSDLAHDRFNRAAVIWIEGG